LQNPICHRRHQQHNTVDRGWRRGEVILAHPACDERDQGQPEKQVQVCPQNGAAHPLRYVEHVVVVVVGFPSY